MNPTRDNRDAIQEMLDVSPDGMTTDQQRELLEQSMLQNATGPETIISAEREQITYKSARELIEVDRHLANKAGSAQSHFGMRFAQLIPPGCG